jgi:DNA-binding LacI/PurR family transcriptional regulator
MEEKIKISDIAMESSVSTATVSLVLNNKPGVSQETRLRVLEVAERLGYAKPSASSGRSSPLTTIGMIVKTEPNSPPQANPFYSKIIVGIEDACRRAGINLLFGTLPVDLNNRIEEVPAMAYGGIAQGLLMVGTFVDETITSIPGRRIPPIVLVDGYSNTESYDAVVSDNFQAAFDAVEYLIKKGHRHIGMIGGEEDSYPSIKQRRNGYLRALKQNGIANSYLADFNIGYEKGFEQTTRLLGANPQITALFAANDEIAVNAMHAAQELGRRVPGDLSVVGYDDTYLAVNTSPKLTTVRVDTVAMGRAAVHLLQLRIENQGTARMTLTIHPVLVERDSVAAPAG